VAIATIATTTEAMRVRVLAGTRIEGRADRHTGSATGVVVRGTLRDDVGRPIPDSHVSIAIFAAAGGAAANLPAAPRTCTPSAGEDREAHFAPDEYVVDTDAMGSFCVITEFPIDRGTMKLSFGGAALYDKTSAEIPFDLSRASVALSFEPEPSIASLDRPMFSVGLRVTAPGIAKDGWSVVLSDEKKRVLGTGGVEPDGHPALVPVRGRRLDEIKPGGLGLHFIRQSMDIVEYQRVGSANQFRLVRYLRPSTQSRTP